MKIFYLSQYIYPLTTGGVGTHIYEIARHVKGIAKDDVDIIIVGGNQSHSCVVDYDIAGLKIKAFNSLIERIRIPGIGTVIDGGISFKPFMLMFREKPDIVHFHGFSGSWLGLLAVLYCSLFRKVLIITPHFHDIRKFKIHPLFYINKLIMHCSKRIIAVTQVEKEKLSKLFNIRTSNINIIYNGVDSELFKLDSLYNKYILYVGQGLEKKKGFEKALKLFMAVKAAHLYDEWRFVAVGRGVDQEKYRKLIPKSIDGSILLLGSVARGKLVELYRTCYMLILPSDYEAFGIVLAEAMACGKPALAYRVGGVPETIIDGVTGYTASDIEDMKLKVLKLMNDIKLTMQLGEAGRKHVLSNFNWEKSATRQYEIYKDVLN